MSINTVTKLLVEAGAKYHNNAVRDVKTTRVECDEIWSFVYAKDRSVDGAKAAPDGAWRRVDADSKMILSYEVGDRFGDTAQGQGLRTLPLAGCVRRRAGHQDGRLSAFCNGPADLLERQVQSPAATR